MVQIFRAPKGNSKKGNNQKQHNPQKLQLNIEQLDHHGQGVCRQHQPLVFVDNALPGESVRVSISDKKSRFWKGRAIDILQPSSQRIAPFCPYFSQCGGCQNQHISAQDMLAHKQSAVDAMLTKVAGTTALNWQPAIYHDQQAYRRKARLAIDNRDKQRLKVGFRAKLSNEVVAIEQCPVLTLPLQKLLPHLLAALHQLHNKNALGHVSLLDSGNQLQVTLRVIKEINEKDKLILANLESASNCRVILETAKNQFEALSASYQPAHYSLQDGIQIALSPNDFIQVNAAVNQQMVEQSIQWLELDKQDRVLDLFCGVGNFSLPLANKVQQLIGIEGVAEMVQQASDNAQRNEISNSRFVQADLTEWNMLNDDGIRHCNKVLLDPARAGALEVIAQLKALKPQKILYVSCNPATFARDMGELLSSGFRLDKIALMDMFPHTVHTELMALFVPN
ncbi:23S rRNA (uracil(1939)-C(5))-methyltransferase RlmD [Neptunicella sp. SCSIO 80796]|uniref:23S rRNA (uracil(1939)-C(5))-methyltransferase RlmD n=1 Tax=Neptunicella plasticusilytica TaxID=3117012 RepID=UPI003A4DE1C0